MKNYLQEYYVLMIRAPQFVWVSYHTGTYVLEYKNQNNPFPNRKERVSIISQMQSDTILGNEDIINTAETIQNLSKAKSKDALHLSCALHSGCKYFITCDNMLICIQNSNHYILIFKYIFFFSFVSLLSFSYI